MICFHHIQFRIFFIFAFAVSLLWPAAPAGAQAPPAGWSESLAREAMIAALTGDRERVRGLTEFAWRCEATSGGLASIGGREISGRLALLEAWMEPSPARQYGLLEAIADSTNDPRVERQARAALSERVDLKINRLRRQDRYNRSTHVFNYFTRVVFNVLTADVQGLARRFIDIFFIGERLTEVTARNRQIIDLYKHLEAEAIRPATPDGALSRVEFRQRIVEIAPYIEGLLRNIDARDARDAVVWGEWHLRQGHPHAARSLFARAQAIELDNAKAKAGRLESARQVSASILARALEEHRAQAPELAPPIPEAEAEEVWRLARTLGAESDEMVRQAARQFQVRQPASSFLDDAIYIELGAGAARSLLQTPGFSGENAARHLGRIEASPWTNPRVAMERAEEERARDTRRYIFFGDQPDFLGPRVFSFQDQLHRYTDTFGLLMPAHWLIRYARHALGKAVPDDPWRSVATRFLPPLDAAEPLDEEQAVVARRLALSYEKMNRFDEARRWYERAGGDGEFDERLEEKEATALLRAARDSQISERRRALLERVVREFADSKAAVKARVDLEDLNMTEASETVYALEITKEDLLSWPDLWRGRGLRLHPDWFDGDNENGELRANGLQMRDEADRGKRIDFTILQSGRDPRSFFWIISAEDFERLRPTLESWERERQTRLAAERNQDGPLVPIEMQASAGPGGFDVYPRLLPLPFDPQELPLYK